MSKFSYSDLYNNVCRYCSMAWFRVSLALCVFGFLKEFRPSEPFVFEYLVGSWRNVTEEQVLQEVYPVGTYSYLAHLFIVFLITDSARYKPLIVVLGISGIAIWSMLIWTTSLINLQILEVLYGTFMATEVAYYTYIYAKVDDEHYQEVSSHTRAAILTGRALSSITAQILISFKIMDYKQLNYITLGAMILATLWALFLPSIKRSIYFHQVSTQRPQSSKIKTAFTLMKKHFMESFNNRYTIKWSLWWALTTAGFVQVQYYAQPLWTEIKEGSKVEGIVYNGAVEAVATIIGALGALLAGYLRIEWRQKGELILSICSICSASITLISSQTTEVIVSYACYVGFCALYHFMITIASSEIAKCIVEDSYGLIFGINTFVALILQTAMTMVFVTKNVGLALSPRNQFLAYGIYHIGIAAIFILIGLISWVKSNKDIKKTYN